VSSIFSGIGSEAIVVEMLSEHYGDVGFPGFHFEHTATFELRAAARSTLKVTTSGALFGDITLLLPAHLRERSDLGSLDFDQLQDIVMDETVVLETECYCHRVEAMVPVDLGHICVSGVPCVDFSSMGQRQGLSGPSGLLILTWIRMLMDFRPAFVVLEEVPQFEQHGLPIVKRLLEGIYTFEVIRLDPKVRGWPVSRPRLYCIATCCESAELTRSLADLSSSCIPDRAHGCGRDFFYMDLPHDVLTGAKRAVLRDYVDLFLQ
jgi:site-specific DNA-cytosine methylase